MYRDARLLADYPKVASCLISKLLVYQLSLVGFTLPRWLIVGLHMMQIIRSDQSAALPT